MLTKDLLDAVAGDPDRVSELALSFDGYAALGKNELYRVSKKAANDFQRSGRLPANLVILRCCLFAEQRGFHHRGETMQGHYVDALVAAIRRRLSGGGTPVMDGEEVLREFASAAGCPSLSHLLAKYTLFLHPETVRQTGGRALFPVVRDRQRRGQRGHIDGMDVVFDDNTTPTWAFLWAADRMRGRDVQYNHVWDKQSQNLRTYTALWNVCVTPASLAKLTDGSAHPETVALMRYRSLDLFGFLPDGAARPTRPDNYDSMSHLWPAAPEPVKLEAVLRRQLAAAPGTRRRRPHVRSAGCSATGPTRRSLRAVGTFRNDDRPWS